MESSRKPTIFVSSAVYGFEDMLDQIYAILDSLGFEVWMSHKGTVPIDPNQSALGSCIASVEKCDYFLGIILPRYGSGKPDKEANSITHEELLKAINLNKKRWILAHEHVVFAKNILKDLGYGTSEDRKKLTIKKGIPIQDLRVIDMLEIAMRHDIKLVKDRAGNWVQEFTEPKDANLFVSSQFRHVSEATDFIEQNIVPRKGDK